MLRNLVLVLLVVATGCERPCARHSDCPQGDRCSAESVCVSADIVAEDAAPDAGALEVDAAVSDAAAAIAVDAVVDALVDAAAPDAGE